MSILEFHIEPYSDATSVPIDSLVTDNSETEQPKVIDRLAINLQEGIHYLVQNSELVELKHNDKLLLDNLLITVLLTPEQLITADENPIIVPEIITQLGFIDYQEPDFPLAQLNNENMPAEFDALLAEPMHNDPLLFLFNKGKAQADNSVLKQFNNTRLNNSYNQPLAILTQHFQAPAAITLQENFNFYDSEPVSTEQQPEPQGNILQDLGIAAAEKHTRATTVTLNELPYHVPKVVGYRDAEDKLTRSHYIAAYSQQLPMTTKAWLGVKRLVLKKVQLLQES